MKSLTEHLFEIKSLTNPFVIDGQIFITVSQADSENNSYRHDLARVIDNQLETVVTDITDVQVTNEHIFYLKANQIYQYFEHSEDKQLTRQSEIITQILPLPDDEHILYVAQITASQPGLNVDQKRPQIHQVSQLTYKADGKGFIFSQPQFELRSVDVTSNDRLLKQFEQEIQIADARSEQKILLMLVDYDKDGLGQKKQLVDFDYRTDLTRIISDKTMVMVDEAIYNPEGSAILFTAKDAAFPNRRVSQLFLYQMLDHETFLQFSAEELSETPLSDTVFKAQNRYVQWLDNTTYAFETGYHGHNRLYLADISGARELVRDEAEALYDFKFLDDFALAVRSTSMHPSQLINLTSGKVILDPNQRYEEHQKYVFRSKNGDIVDGWFLPNQQHKKAPVIVYVHGGPHSAYGEAFFWEFQMLSRAGYNLVYVNPHGSTTYGQSFIESVIGHYGEQDFEDILTGLDVAIAQHSDLIDEQAQYIIGGSYGGFMTGWAITHTNRFKAAIAQRSVMDWQSLVGTSDIGYYYVASEMDAAPYTARGRKVLAEKSPITYAEQVVTPLLLMHGEYDMRTPIEQSEAFFAAVKLTTSTDVVMARLPQAWHDVSRHGLPSLRLDRMDLIVEWLTRYGTLRV